MRHRAKTDAPHLVAVFPWPKDLGPNERAHWAVMARRKKDYRHACWALARQHVPEPWPDAPVHVHLNFCPPSKRHYDEDNLIAAMKAGLDGLSDAIKVDDRKFKLTHVVSRDTIRGWVEVTAWQPPEGL